MALLTVLVVGEELSAMKDIHARHFKLLLPHLYLLTFFIQACLSANSACTFEEPGKKTHPHNKSK